MIPKEIISRAIEGGWRTAPYYKGKTLTKDDVESIAEFFTDQSGSGFKTWQEIAFAPSFWQSLGKALGWGLVLGWEEAYAPTENAAQEWYQNAFHFYEQVLTGGDLELYWKDLLK